MNSLKICLWLGTFIWHIWVIFGRSTTHLWHIMAHTHMTYIYICWSIQYTVCIYICIYIYICICIYCMDHSTCFVYRYIWKSTSLSIAKWFQQRLKERCISAYICTSGECLLFPCWSIKRHGNLGWYPLLKIAKEIVSFPIKNGGPFHSYVSLPEGRCLYHPPFFFMALPTRLRWDSSSDALKRKRWSHAEFFGLHRGADKGFVDRLTLENTKQSAKGHRVSSTIKDISDVVS